MATRSSRRLRDAATLLAVLLLLLAVSLLPPDTSLRRVEESNLLRACVPSSYPPLVTPEGQDPGIDVEVVEALAQSLGVRLLLNTNPAMGRDFNPRSWRLVRAQCQVIVGGVVDSPTTRAFLDVTPAYLETGWVLLSPRGTQPLENTSVGVYTSVAALDRITLSRYLRAQGADVAIIQQADELASGLESGRYSAVVTEALLARQLAFGRDLTVTWLPGLARLPLVIGLWKGDLTLKRRMVAALRGLEQDGTLAAIMGRYDLAPVRERGPH